MEYHIYSAFRADQNMLLFSPANFEMQFFSETFKMDFKLSTSHKCFAVSGFHPPPVKQDAEDLPLNSTLRSLLSPTSQALSVGSDTRPQANTKRGALGEQCGGRKVTANPKLPCHSPLSGTARGQCLQCHCCVRGAMGPFPPHLGDSAKIVLVPRGCLGDS